MTNPLIEFKYNIFKTRAGWIGALASAKGLRRLTLPVSSLERTKGQLIIPGLDNIALAPERFAELEACLKAYFNGKKVTFDDKLDLSEFTTFQRKVWTATRLIPYGETRSYSWIAHHIGRPRAARGVGQALARNPLSIIVPCHRVIASNGELCGFGGGLEMKRFLLKLEGIKF